MQQIESSSAFSEISDLNEQNNNLIIERFLKKHLKLLDQEKISDIGRILLNMITSRTFYKSTLFDSAYLIYQGSDKIVPQALLWIIADPYDKEQVTCRLYILSAEMAEKKILDQALNFVNKLHTDVYSIKWLIRPDQEQFLELLADVNYNIHTDLNLELPDYVTGQRSHFMVAVQHYYERLDRAVAFINFLPGMITVSGDQQGIYSIKFWHTGEYVSDKCVRWTADSVGLLDSAGHLINVDQHVGVKLKEERSEILPGPVKQARLQLYEYIEGSRKFFDLPLNFSKASIFQQDVWKLIQDIPYANTSTYEELARFLVEDGQKPAHLARAIGAACSTNPLPIVIPCHRVIGKDGKLTGFSGGLDVKEYLLNHEILGV